MPVFHNMQNQENLMTQTQDIRQKPNFGPKLDQMAEIRALTIFFLPIYHFHQIDTMPVYH